jgi:hypothetical protein
MERNVRISKRYQLISPELIEQFAELEWLREQVRKAELRNDPAKLLTAFKSHRAQKAERKQLTHSSALRRRIKS